MRDPVEQVHYAIERPFFKDGLPACRYMLKPSECQFRQAAERAIPAFRAWQGTPQFPFDCWRPYAVVGSGVRLSAHPSTVRALKALPYRDYPGMDLHLPPGIDLHFPDKSLIDFTEDELAYPGALHVGLPDDSKEPSNS